MAYKGEACVRTFLVWDVANEEPKTGLTPATDLAMRLIADGVADDAAGTVTEVENGWYKIAISAAENAADHVVLQGTCTVADCQVVGERWFNSPQPLTGVLADLDTDEGSAAWALLTLLKRTMGPAETTENAGGAITEVYEDAIGGTVRATSTVSSAGGVVTKEMS